MEDILEGHPGEDDPPPCEMAGKDVKYECLFKEDREYNQVTRQICNLWHVMRDV